jgi:hypothetical protein
MVMRICGDGENLRGQLDGVSLVVLGLRGPARGLAEPRASYCQVLVSVMVVRV